MFRFEYGDSLYALGVVPVLVFFFVAAWFARTNALKRFGDLNLIQRLMPQASNDKHILKFVFLAVAMALMIVGWANPQWGTKREQVKRKSVDIFFALDISQSMMAEDISPSRLERAKRFTQSLVETFKGERLGSIIFAGNAYLQVPLTTDYAAVSLFLRSTNTGMAPTQGTAIVDAIDLAERSFDEKNKNNKALIIITDGENHDSEALERAKKAGDNGLLIFTVGVGTEEGSFIPTFYGGRQDYKRDETGNPVRSKLNEKMLMDLAQTGNGAYFNLLNGSEKVAQALESKIADMEKREFEQRVFSDFESYFQYFIGAGLLLLIIEFVIAYRKSKFLTGRDFFGTV